MNILEAMQIMYPERILDMYDLDAARMAETLEELFWPDYRTKFDEQNKRFYVYGDPELLFASLKLLLSRGLFKGSVTIQPDGACVYLDTGFTPRRN